MVVGVTPVVLALMVLSDVTEANWSGGVQAGISFHFANWALIKIPGQPSDYEGMLKSLLTLADIMPTGYHAARVANVQKVNQGSRYQGWCCWSVLLRLLRSQNA